MKKIGLCLLSILTAVAVFAQTDAIRQYVDTYSEIAIREMIRTGVPASITLAQGIVESQAGQSDLVKSSNNHFGIKCKEEWTGDCVYHDDDLKNECFRVYNSAEESFRDHSDFLKSRPYYTGLFSINPADYKAWAKGLKKAGYATERNYPEMLVKMIEANGLQQYTLVALERMKLNDATTAYLNNDSNTSAALTASVQPQADDNAGDANSAAKSAPSDQPVASAPLKDESQGEGSISINRKEGYPEGVFTINSRRVIYAKEGTSLLSLAVKYDVKLSSLLEYNELAKRDILKKDRLIFLQRKLTKGEKEYHTVTGHETMDDIAQTEGIRLESLLEYNKAEKGQRLSAGKRIYLRPRTTTATASRSSKREKSLKSVKSSQVSKKKRHKARTA